MCYQAGLDNSLNGKAIRRFLLLKLVSAAGIAPAVAPSRTEHVAATPRAVCPGAIRKGAGGLFSLEADRAVPGRRPAERFVGKVSGESVISRSVGSQRISDQTLVH